MSPKTPSILLLLALAAAARAATYYSAPGGSDSAAGSLAAPFATVQHGVDALRPGDTLVLRQGDYQEAVQFPRSGASNEPITLKAYPGECPTLDGARTLAGPWTAAGASIYRSSYPQQPQQVFCEGLLLNEARWPAAGVEGLSSQPVALADSGSATGVACAALAAMNLSGALIQIMPGQSWTSYTRTIASQGPGGALTFDSPIDALPQLVPRRGDRFYVFGALSLLTAPGEWYWDPGTQSLYVWAPDGGAPAGRVEAGPAHWVLTLDNRSYITVQGLDAVGGGFSLQNSSYCTVQGCSLRAPTWTRIRNGYNTPAEAGGAQVSGTGNQWLGGSIAYAGASAIVLSGTGQTVNGLTVQDCDWNWGSNAGIALESAQQSLVEYCTVNRVAQAAIVQAQGGPNRILSNLLENVALYTDDIGAFDAWSSDGQGTEIAYNLCKNNLAMWGAGVYLDDYSANFKVHDNVIQGSAWYGITFKAVNTITNNTILDAGHEAIHSEASQGLTPSAWSLAGATVAHNQVQEALPVRVELSSGNIADYGYYGGTADLSPGARRVELDWAQLGQAWWAMPVPQDLTQVNAIVFNMGCTSTFNYSVTNLRYLPAGQSGDAGAVAAPGASWYASAGPSSSATLDENAPGAWGVTGSTGVILDWAEVGASLGGSRDLSGYRGLAFDISGTAQHAYTWVGCTDLDNGPEAEAGRGATLLAQTGAPAF